MPISPVKPSSGNYPASPPPNAAAAYSLALLSKLSELLEQLMKS